MDDVEGVTIEVDPDWPLFLWIRDFWKVALAPSLLDEQNLNLGCVNLRSDAI